MSIEALLANLDKVKRTGQGRWLACCSAHQDKTPSLSIRELPDGAILLHCFAGCSAYDIVSAVGMDITDLFPETEKHQSPKQRSPISPRDVLIALQPEIYAIALIGSQMSRGIANDEKTQQALITAVSRVSSAHTYTEGL